MSMPKGARIKQFCPRKHDTFICGRTKRGNCRDCKNEEQKEYAIRKADIIKKRIERNREKVKIFGQNIEVRFSKAKSSAKARKLSWSITLEDYDNFIVQSCFYCGNKLNLYGIGLDRLDNSKGYLSDNVVPCCGDCNYIKSDILTAEEMVAAMRAVKQVRLNKVLSNNILEVK